MLKSFLKKKPDLMFFIRLGVSVGLLIYLINILDWNRSIYALNHSNIVFLTIAPCLFIIGYGLASLRWKVILSENSIIYSFRETISTYMIGGFYNVFFPGAIGGDLIRIWRCAEQSRADYVTVTLTVILERTMGLIALLSIAHIAYLILIRKYSFFFFGPELNTYIGLSSVLITAVLIIALTFRRGISRRIPLEFESRFFKFLSNCLKTILGTRLKILFIIFILSISFQFIDIVITYLIAKAIGIVIPFVAVAAIVPVVYLMTILPISLGGLGVREGTLVILLSRFGIIPSDAIMLSFLIYFMRISVGACGGLIELHELLKNRLNQKSDDFEHV